MNDEISSPSARRGGILLDQGRYSEAEKYFREALAIEPNDAEVLFRLAICEANQKRSAEAHRTICQALALTPTVASLHALKAHIEANMKRPGEALKSADQALELDPECDQAFVARAAAFWEMQRWADAEIAAREALDINPENSAAANQLANALRLQNRLGESKGQIAYMLARDPEDARTHVAAGWTALQGGNRADAERHFLEALRLEPGLVAAKDGLKEAFRARSPIYRIYLNYCFFMQRFTAGKRWLIVIGFLAIPRLASLIGGPFAGLVAIAYFLFVLWVHVARPVGNFQLLLDRFARHALDRGEMIEACASGGSILVGLPLIIAGAFTKFPPACVIGATLVGAAFPFAYTFTNASKGKWLFGAIGATVLIAGLLNLLVIMGLEGISSSATALAGFAFLGVAATTWLANVRALNS
jgi:tetratricopeptide (TPR) repeat protein